MDNKTITKIVFKKGEDNFVADIENIENRISQNSSNLETAKQELSNKYDTILSKVDLTGIVKSVNSIKPDIDGNVNVTGVSGNTDGSGNSSVDSLPVGAITFFSSATVPTGYLICNGVAVSRTTFSNLFSVIGTSFGSGDGENTFNLPNLLDKFIEGSETVGTSKDAGLPNITGTTGYTVTANDDTTTGALSKRSQSTAGCQALAAGPGKFTVLGFDASKSNNIYGSSNTVQPSSVTLLPCIKAYSSVTNSSDIDVTAFLNTVTNLPANYLSLGNQAISDTQLKSVSDKLRLSSSCLPSATYDELTHVNDTAYTAPADGWFVFSGEMSTSNCYISLLHTVTGLRHLSAAQPAGAFLCVYMMARKGETVFLDHSPYTTAKVNKFCYNNPTDKE